MPLPDLAVNWIAEDTEHIVHFNGERFLGPYPDTVLAWTPKPPCIWRDSLDACPPKPMPAVPDEFAVERILIDGLPLPALTLFLHAFELFQTTIPSISMHICNIYAKGELMPGATVKDSLTVHREGSRDVQRWREFYNLYMIISVG